MGSGGGLARGAQAARFLERLLECGDECVCVRREVDPLRVIPKSRDERGNRGKPCGEVFVEFQRAEAFREPGDNMRNDADIERAHYPRNFFKRKRARHPDVGVGG